MPEAVSSHTTHASAGQPSFDAEFEAFDTTIHQVAALTEMLGSFMDEYCKTTSTHGIYSLFRQQAGDLRAIYGSFSDGIAAMDITIQQLTRDVLNYREKQEAMEEGGEKNVAMFMQMKLRRLAFNVWMEVNGREPNEEEKARLVDLAKSYGSDIRSRMKATHDPIEAGSFLPWAEAEFRNELSQGQEKPAAIADRDRLIVELVKGGAHPSQVSQTFNIRREAVERIIGRLSAGEDSVSDDVRAKIEKAADAGEQVAS
ncbi:hypothetical protein [Agrobacterium pusense]|uniref:Uncharacterized protein n=1 Tax=Agrobacterium pusense TaxID=648995 RepID=A0AA44EJ12_9HYPH|nr:hypothetical protein [Agrobacterium pusense]NRF09394.1 hypothetical protein [Agrobacterium pusense]NRF19701.1 hypothetical protein [Agrobacterium pusense]